MFSVIDIRYDWAPEGIVGKSESLEEAKTIRFNYLCNSKNLHLDPMAVYIINWENGDLILYTEEEYKEIENVKMPGFYN